MFDKKGKPERADVTVLEEDEADKKNTLNETVTEQHEEDCEAEVTEAR